MAPSAAPAPTSVCNSSTNRIVSPSWASISLITDFKRSSNSPRNLEPATIDAMSSDTISFPLSVSATSSPAMRWAKPSTTAVFPTPGSPINTGLFLRRRDKICSMRRISDSRPMTGSNSFRLAISVRFVEYFLRI